MKKFFFYNKSPVLSFPLPTTLLAPSYDLATKLAKKSLWQVKILVKESGCHQKVN